MLKEIEDITKEHFSNLTLIRKFSVSVMKQETLRTSLGVWWSYIHDFIYLAVFIGFRILMSGGNDIYGMNSVLYLVSGIIPWFFMNDVLGMGTSSLISSSSIITNLHFPVSIIPTSYVTSVFLKRLPTLLILLAASLLLDGHFYILQFLYFFLCMFLLLFAFNLLFSAFIVISRDFHQLYLAFLRILVFSLPILWSFEHVERIAWLNLLLHLNPMVYVISGFRYAFALRIWPSSLYTVYFWACTALLFVLGCKVQFKLRKYYSDFL